MKVVFAREAIEDLVAIGEFIAASNQKRAESFVDELEAKCLDLANNPFAFERILSGASGDIRKRPSGRYLIFYEVGEDRIEVLHILHGARDYGKIFPMDRDAL